MDKQIEWQNFLQGYLPAKDIAIENILQENIFTDLSHLCVIKISGKDTEKFLQGKLTCDIREVKPDQSQSAAYCNLKGRVIASMRALKYAEDYYLLIPRSMQELLITQLKKYAIFTKINFTLDQEWVIWGCAGKDILQYCQTYFNAFPSKINEVSLLNNESFCLQVNISGAQPRVIFLAPLHSAMTLASQLLTLIKRVDEDRWRLLDILTGVATIYPQTSELFTPHMLHYPRLGAVSFTKGCYLGQEIIARAEYLGKTKRTLCQAVVSTSNQLQPGEKLFNISSQQESGAIVEAASWINDSQKLLAVVNEEAASQGRCQLANGCIVQLQLSNSSR